MSPGPTFERVYTELKRQLRAGTRPPGTPLEPTAIGDELGTSFTPVRDALHRLVGEGLVENPKHNGFSVPHLTEQALRDLYAWNGELLVVMIAHTRAYIEPPRPIDTEADTTVETAALFIGIAEGSGNREHVRAITQLNDRLAPFRRAEPRILSDVRDELRDVGLLAARLARAELSRALSNYHKRRIGAVSRILEVLTSD